MATQYTAGLTTGEVLTAATMNSIGAAWETFTPTWTGSSTNPVIGNGTLVGKYLRIQKLVIAQYAIVAGSTTTFGSGVYEFSYPITPLAFQYAYVAIGGGYILDSSAANAYTVAANPRNGSTTKFGLRYTGAGFFGDVQNSTPFTFANTDVITFTIEYEAA